MKSIHYRAPASWYLKLSYVLILINDQAPATQFSKAVFTGIFYTHRSCNCCLGLWEQLVPSVGLVSGIGNQGWRRSHLDFGLTIGLWPLGGGRPSSVVTTRRERGREGRTAGVLYRPSTLVRVELWSRNINTRQQAESATFNITDRIRQGN